MRYDLPYNFGDAYLFGMFAVAALGAIALCFMN